MSREREDREKKNGPRFDVDSSVAPRGRTGLDDFQLPMNIYSEMNTLVIMLSKLSPNKNSGEC